MGWPKIHFFCKIKDVFFIFINNCIDLDILSMSAISHYIGFWRIEAGGAALHLPMCKTAHSKELFGQNVNSTEKLGKPFLTQSVTTFFKFQLRFYLS